MRLFYISDDRTFRLYEMEDDLYVSETLAMLPQQAVTLMDEDIVPTIEAMTAYAMKKGLLKGPLKTADLDELEKAAEEKQRG